MPWIILFTISWVVFFLLIDWHKLKVNIWCGIIAVLIQLSTDTHAMTHHLYKVNKGTVHILGSSVFFAFGPVFVIGVLLSQYHPARRLLVFLNVLVLSVLYSFEELLLLATNALAYLNWHFTDSLIINVCVIITLSWFSIIILGKGGKFQQ